jgi:hypothetical protein
MGHVISSFLNQFKCWMNVAYIWNNKNILAAGKHFCVDDNPWLKSWKCLVIHNCSFDCNHLLVFTEGKLAENGICASFRAQIYIINLDYI